MGENILVKHISENKRSGRILVTLFASNVNRLGAIKKAADLADRKVCFIGISLRTYLEAAQNDGRAPFDLKELLSSADIKHLSPSKLLIVTTGSQAEPKSQLSLASRKISSLLKLVPNDLFLYSAKIIPGNETKVIRMMNRISQLGPDIKMGKEEGLHTSGHAYKEEQRELLQLVKPENFLPVHGERAFLCAHAQLGKDMGIPNVHVLRNGLILGVHKNSNTQTFSTGSVTLLGETKLQLCYNYDQGGAGTASEMAMAERITLANEGLIICAIDVIRHISFSNDIQEKDYNTNSYRLHGLIRITTRALWTNKSLLLHELYKACRRELESLPSNTKLSYIEYKIEEAVKRAAKSLTGCRPEVIVVTHERDQRIAQIISLNLKNNFSYLS